MKKLFIFERVLKIFVSFKFPKIPRRGGEINLDQTGMCHLPLLNRKDRSHTQNDTRTQKHNMFWSGKTPKLYPILEPRMLIIYPALQLLNPSLKQNHVSYHILSYCIVSYHTLLYHLISSHPRHIVSYHNYYLLTEFGFRTVRY